MEPRTMSRWVGRAILARAGGAVRAARASLRGQRAARRPATPRGSLAPDVGGPLLVGSDRFRLSAERGHPVALVFWALVVRAVPRASCPASSAWPGAASRRRTRRASSPSTPRAIATTRSRRRPSCGLTLPIVLDDGSASSAYRVSD